MMHITCTICSFSIVDMIVHVTGCNTIPMFPPAILKTYYFYVTVLATPKLNPLFSINDQPAAGLVMRLHCTCVYLVSGHHREYKW